jgi:transcriptional regulator with XRE-family HTH domain
MASVLPHAVVSFSMDHPLGRWRAWHQISQEALAQRCGLSQKAISAYELGTRVPRDQSLKRLVEVTGLPLEALVFPEQFLRDHPDFLMQRPRL